MKIDFTLNVWIHVKQFILKRDTGSSNCEYIEFFSLNVSSDGVSNTLHLRGRTYTYFSQVLFFLPIEVDEDVNLNLETSFVQFRISEVRLIN